MRNFRCTFVETDKNAVEADLDKAASFTELITAEQ